MNIKITEVKAFSALPNPRQSNIELLRIVLMLMIITHHIIVHGLGLRHIGEPSYSIDTYTYYELGLNSFAVIAVNTFVFISGYFGIKFKLNTVFSLVSQALFYSIVLYFLFIWLGLSKWSNSDFIKSFIPISINTWWFVTTYLGLYFASPFLNKGIDLIDAKELKILIAGLLFLNCFPGFLFGSLSGTGASVFHFICMYLTGRYFYKYKIQPKNALLKLFCSTLLLFALSLILFHYKMLGKIGHLYHFNNPIVIISSIMLFFSFKSMNLKHNRFINLAAGSVIGIYMLHDHSSVRALLISFISQMKILYGDQFLLFITLLSALALSILFSGATIEILRKKIADLVMKKLNLFPNSKIDYPNEQQPKNSETIISS